MACNGQGGQGYACRGGQNAEGSQYYVKNQDTVPKK